MRSIRTPYVILAFLVCFVGLSQYAFAQSDAVELDQRILKDTDREFGGVYRDMGVVQRKAMNKRHRLLGSLFGSLDLSDLPYSNLGLNIDVGWAISDFFEIYAHLVPLYKNSLRNYASQLGNYTCSAAAVAAGICSPNEQPLADVSKTKSGYGFTILWAPSYGKDSIGSKTILRSDTFLKFSYARMNYQGLNVNTGKQVSNSGNSFTFGVGKTFFLGSYIGLRIAADAIYQGIPNLAGQVSNFFIGGVELGSMFYW